jgi:hypothetical protein
VIADECYRCGYDLRGIGDEQACPECGLLARRSRRKTDELHDSRPRWLRGLSRGVKLILLSLLLPVPWDIVAQMLALQFASANPFNHPTWIPGIYLGGFCGIALLFFAGVWLLTRREGYAPADSADRNLRISLRITAAAPLVAIVLLFCWMELALNRFTFGGSLGAALGQIAFYVGIFGTAPLPFLLFRRLRSVARRARSAHLAEHCTIVGIGVSAGLIYLALFVFMANDPKLFGLDSNWMTRSKVSLAMSAILSTIVVLFALWSLYLLVRFAIALHIAAGKLQDQWLRDDRGRKI